MGFGARGMSQVWETLFLSLPQFQMPRGQQTKAQLLPHGADTYPLHIKLYITLETGQDHKALMNLQFINSFYFCS